MSNLNNIIHVKPSYNSHKIEETIYQLNNEVNEQREINRILTDKNFNNKTKDISDFIEIHEGGIDDQLFRLKKVVDELKTIIEINNKLKKNENNYRDLIESEKSQKIAKTINELNKLKKEALLFLENSKIQNLNIV